MESAMIQAILGSSIEVFRMHCRRGARVLRTRDVLNHQARVARKGDLCARRRGGQRYTATLAGRFCDACDERTKYARGHLVCVAQGERDVGVLYERLRCGAGTERSCSP